MKIRILNAAAVRKLLPMDRCIELMRSAFVLVARGQAVQPIRQGVHVPEGHGLIGWMPGYTASPPWLGVKVVTVFEKNFGTEFGSHQGMVLLFDTRTGAPRAIIDGQEITGVRTAAATAAATDVLARQDASSLAIFGYGRQAREHLASLPLVRKFDRIYVWGRKIEQVRSFAAECAKQFNLPIEAAETLEAAAKADVLCTVTAAVDPFLRGEWLVPGQHVNLVGSSYPTKAEADTDVVRRSRYFTDFKESALALAGEFLRAKAAGAMTGDDILGTIGDVIDGRLRGRLSASDITVFKSLGMSSEDLIAADHVLSQAEQLGVGDVIDW